MNFNIRGTTAGIRYPCFAEIKYDGEFNIWLPNAGASKLVNKYGKIRTNHITDELNSLNLDHGLIGELHHGWGLDGDLYKLLENKNSPDLKFAIFDVGNEISLIGGSYRERREWLLEHFQPTPHCYIVNTAYIEDVHQRDLFFTQITSNGYEGIVLKNADSLSPNNWVKIKAKRTADLKINAIDPLRERIEVTVPFGRPIPVGVKVSEKIKKTLKVGDVVEIEYQSQLPSGSLRHPRFLRKREPGKEVSI